MISVGGSLAGELTSWFRARYPWLVDMGLASSAPILGYPGYSSEYGWYATVTGAFQRAGGDACVEQIRSGFTELPRLTPAELTKAFNTCTPATKWCDYMQFTQSVYDWVGGAAEGGYPPTLSPVNKACSLMDGKTTTAAAWKALFEDSSGGGSTAGGGCLNITWASTCSGDTPVHEPHHAAHHAATGGGAAANEHRGSSSSSKSTLSTNMWDYLACTTEVHPIGSNNVTDFLPPVKWDMAATQEWCQTMYSTAALNAPPGTFKPAKAFMRPNAMPRAFGEVDLAKFATATSRIIFSSGQNDPWSSQSITKTLSPSLPAVMISLGAHHSDLGGPYNPVPTASDTASLNKTRAFEIATLQKWIEATHDERAAAKHHVDHNADTIMF